MATIQMAGLRQRAYAVYLLTRQGNVTTNFLASVKKRLQDAYPGGWKNDLAAGWLAASYQMLKQDKQAVPADRRGCSASWSAPGDDGRNMTTAITSTR